MRSFWLLLLLPVAACLVPLRDDRVEKDEFELDKAPAIHDVKDREVRFDVCSECKTVVKEILVVIDDPVKLAELKIVLSALCDWTSRPEQCKMAVAKIDVIIHSLEPYLKNPEAVCKKIDLCKAPALVDILRRKLHKDHADDSAMLQKSGVHDKGNRVRFDVCSECKTVIKEVLVVIDDPVKLAELKVVLSALCDWTSRPEQCKMAVAKIDVIIHSLEPYLRNPEAVCKKIDLCKAPSFIDLLRLNQQKDVVDDSAKKPGALGNENRVRFDVCSECKAVIKEVLVVIDDPVKLAELKVVLSGLCDWTSRPEECKMAVAKIDVIIHSLEPYLRNPEAVCKKIDLCKAPSFIDLLQRLQHKDVADDTAKKMTCKECQEAMIYVKMEIDNPINQLKAKTVLGNYCNKWSGWSKDTCDWIVQSSIGYLQSKIDEMLDDPEMSCEKLSYCPDPTVSAPKFKSLGWMHTVKEWEDQQPLSA